MTRFYVDYQHGKQRVTDDIGSPWKSFEQARNAAVDVVILAARDAVLDDDGCQFIATIRDDAGTLLYRAKLIFEGEWLIEAQR